MGRSLFRWVSVEHVTLCNWGYPAQLNFFFLEVTQCPGTPKDAVAQGQSHEAEERVQLQDSQARAPQGAMVFDCQEEPGEYLAFKKKKKRFKACKYYLPLQNGVRTTKW